MADKVSLKLSAAAAAYIANGARKEDKLKAARGEVPLCVTDLANVLLFLTLDADSEVKASAVRSLREMPAELLKVIAETEDVHPKVYEILARFHPQMPARSGSVASVSGTQTIATTVDPEPVVESGEELQDCSSDTVDEPVELEDGLPDSVEDEVAGEINDESEEFLSKYKLSMQLSIAEKIKVALTGDKEWRSILTKDSNKLVSSAVIKNPRITQSEILSISKSKIQNDDILRLICMNREWLKNYNIRKALVENNKTPLPKALRFMATLTVKDIGALAKNRNVPSVISNQARRLLTTKNKSG